MFLPGVGKLDLGVGISQLEVGKFNWTHNPLHFHPQPKPSEHDAR